MKFVNGDIFESHAEALVNPVNLDGFMGKGLAFQFGKKYPNNLEEYKEKAKDKKIGDSLIYKRENKKLIINFPTKVSWRKPSQIEYIIEGLKQLKEIIKRENCKSIAIPSLGVGNGKLAWVDVKKEIEKFSLEVSKDVEIIVYEPEKSKMRITEAQYLILKFINLVTAKEELKGVLTNRILINMMYIFDINKKKSYFKCGKTEVGIHSDFLNMNYRNLKLYKKENNNKTLKEIEEGYKKIFTTKKLEGEEKKIIRAKEILEKIYSEKSEETGEVLERMTVILFIIKHLSKIEEKLTQNKINEEIEKWSPKIKEKFEKINLSDDLKYLSENGIIEENSYYIKKKL